MSERVLGEGGYGKVVLARHVPSGTGVAVKRVVTDRPEAVELEVRAMKAAGSHGNLCALHDFTCTADRKTWYLVLELCPGGELFARVESGILTEGVARELFIGILAGVRHLHGQGIAHRDLKLENVLMAGPNADVPKICDLGLAHVYARTDDGAIDNSARLTQWCGSRNYCPPEVLARLPYDGFAADRWSLGILLFAMLAGFFPIEEATQQDWRFARLALLQIGGQPPQKSAGGGAPGLASSEVEVVPPTTQAVFDFYGRPCPFSASLAALLDRMITIKPRLRPTLDVIAASRWLSPWLSASGAEGGATTLPATKSGAPPSPDAPPTPSAAPAMPADSEVDVDVAEIVYRSWSVGEAQGGVWAGACGDASGALGASTASAAGAAPPSMCRQRAFSHLPEPFTPLPP